MSKAFFLSLLLLNLSLFLSQCVGNSGSGTASFIPDVELDCASTQATDCSLEGLDMFAGLVSGLDLSCEEYLESLTPLTLTAAFDASGTTTGNKDGIYLNGFVTSWVDATGSSITNLGGGSYTVCAFVDTNSNRQLDSGEALGLGLAQPGTSSVTIDDWYNY